MVPVDELLEALWPGFAPAAAKRSLEVHLSRLRAVLPSRHGEGRLSSRSPGYVLRIAPDERDVDRFEDMLGAGRDALAAGDSVEAAVVLRDALALWRGEPLADVAYEAFAQSEIARLKELRAEALMARIEADLQLGRHAQVIGDLRMLLGKEPQREQAWQHLMVALYRSGRQQEALEAFREAHKRLSDDLGLKPGRELRDLEHAILVQDPRLETGATEADAGNLPAAATPLVGRDRDLARACELLGQRSVRLLTLTGPAGVGKTRLALAIGALVRSDFANGAFFVDLAPIADATLVPRAIAHAVGMPEHGKDAAAMLRARLRARKFLLVLDNFEHLLPAAPFVAELLAAAPHGAVVVASREALQLSGEHVHPVPPLEIPRDGLTDPSALAAVESVALFVERARAADPTLSLDETTASAIAAICRRLEGLPLALELAAAQAATLSPDQILARLDERLHALGEGPRDLPVRQRSLHAAIDWSYELLAEDQRRALRRLAIFVGGFTLASASAVCDADERAVQSLVRKSLLRRVPGIEARFAMLETVREYAAERLQASGEHDRLQRRHAEFFRELAESAAPHLRGPQQLEWLVRLDDEQQNLRAALDRAVATAPALALQLGGALWEYWEARGFIAEARERLDAALSASESADRARAQALFATGRIALRQGDFDHAERSFRDALRLFQQEEDAEGVALATAGLGWVALTAGWIDDAVALCRDSVEIARTTGVDWVIADALNNLGTAHRLAGDLQAASAVLDDALAIRRKRGDLEGVSATLGSLAWVAVAKSEYRLADALFEQALDISARRNDIWYATAAHIARSYVALAAGDLEQARSFAEKGLEGSRELGWVKLAASALGTLAAVHARSREPRRCALVAGMARAAGRRGPTADGRPEQATFAYGWETAAIESALAQAREDLGRPAWDQLSAQGEALWSEEQERVLLE